MIRVYDSGYRGECRKEEYEQIDCASWLRFNHPDRWPLVFHVANETKANAHYMQKRQKMGVSPGVADIIDFGVVRGAFELKRLDKSQCSVSKDQRAFLTSTDETGGFAAICYGFEQFKLAYSDYLGFIEENS